MIKTISNNKIIFNNNNSNNINLKTITIPLKKKYKIANI